MSDEFREELTRNALGAMASLQRKLPLTGRYWITVVPPHIRQSNYGSSNMKSAISLEIEDWAGFEQFEDDHDFLALRVNRFVAMEEVRVRAVVPGYRGTVRGWFPHIDYPLIAPLPFRFVQGRFHYDFGGSAISMADKTPMFDMPYLTKRGQDEFDRLGLHDFKLAMDINRNASNQQPYRPYLHYAAFRDEDQWMTAKMRFTNLNPA